MKILIIGGNRFFGKRLATNLVQESHEVTLLNRGQEVDGLHDRVQRIKADRKIEPSLRASVNGKKWDLIFDQVCYTAEEARIACDIFRDKTSRYIVTSTESVYDNGFDQKENCFDPSTYDFSKDVSMSENYQEAKRQMEAVFARSAFSEIAIVRPSLVVGLDDWTGRLKWHVERIAKDLPVYFPNIDIESDFIRSDQMALAIQSIGFSKHTGPVNCTSPDSISLKVLVDWCEKIVGKKANLVSSEEGDNHSPYGGSEAKTMNTELLVSLGVRVEPSKKWMEELISEIAKS